MTRRTLRMPSRISMGNLSTAPVSRSSFPTPTLVLEMTEIDVAAVKTTTGITEAGKYIVSSVEIEKLCWPFS